MVPDLLPVSFGWEAHVHRSISPRQRPVLSLTVQAQGGRGDPEGGGGRSRHAVGGVPALIRLHEARSRWIGDVIDSDGLPRLGPRGDGLHPRAASFSSGEYHANVLPGRQGDGSRIKYVRWGGRKRRLGQVGAPKHTEDGLAAIQHAEAHGVLPPAHKPSCPVNWVQNPVTPLVPARGGAAVNGLQDLFLSKARPPAPGDHLVDQLRDARPQERRGINVPAEGLGVLLRDERDGRVGGGALQRPRD
mmetsp:Transcript_30278/g.96840  ORF Transcript_30278/g.96840 Transcript_30278/m.96840 type:complete len:246 (-) Transcript_30278:483-1220(-)